MNSGAALNYIQAAIKVLGDSDKPNPEFVKECKRCFRTLEGMQLSDTHQKRYARLHEEAREAGVFK